MSVMLVLWFGVQMAYHLQAVWYLFCRDSVAQFFIPAIVMVTVWTLSWGGLLQVTTLLLFESTAADCNVALESITPLSVVIMNTAVVIKSPSAWGPDCGLLMSYNEWSVLASDCSFQFKFKSRTVPVCVTLQVSMISCPGQTGPVDAGWVTSNATVFMPTATSGTHNTPKIPYHRKYSTIMIAKYLKN